MIVLGVNAYGHDAAAVLLVNGEVAFASSQERFDRVRHSAAFPAEAIAAALAHAGIQPTEIDHVAFPWPRGMARSRKAWHVLRHLPRSLAYLRDAPDALVPSRRGYLRAMAGLARAVRDAGIPAPVVRVPHHLAHAASAQLALPGGAGAIVTADGMGSWTTAATWVAAGRTLARQGRAVYPHSPGKAYAAVTQWLGFRPESDEGKTMGLAAYGKRSPARDFAEGLLAPHPDARRVLRVRQDAFGFPWGHARLYGDAFVEALGAARNPDEALRPHDADVAAGIQRAIEQTFLHVAGNLLSSSGASSLAVAGGLFLNCALNGVLQRTLPAGVHPFPVAGDAGAAWGAAAHVHAQATGQLAAPLKSLRLGAAIADADAARIASAHGGSRFDSVEALAAAVVARVRAGRLVGVARGRAEFGPRALGGRSLIGRAGARADRDRVNEHKGRELWRPLAPVVREDDRRWFEGLRPSPHMILTFPATTTTRQRAPAALHEDGSARVQTVGPHDDDLLYAMLRALRDAGEPDIVLNTSLNRPGEPIVNTADEAWTAVTKMRADALVLNDWLVDLHPYADDAAGSPAP